MKDLKEKYKYIKPYYTMYLFICILFMILSPQYFGAVLSMVFLFPMFIGMKGMKKGNKQGFLFSLSILPVAFMTAAVWIRYGIYVISNYTLSLNEMIEKSGMSLTLAKILLISFPFLAVVLMILCCIQIFNAIKIKKIFI